MTKEILGLHGAVHIRAWKKTLCGGEELIKDDTFHNLIVNVGKDTILKGLAGAGLTGFGTTAAIGVGDSTTCPALAQTDLVGTCKFWKDIPSICKVYIRPTVFVSVDFGYSCANFTWNELGLADDQGCPLNAPACCSLLIARQVDCSPLIKDCTKRAIVEWQLTL